MDVTFFRKSLPDGRDVEVWPLTFGRARLVVGRELYASYDDGW